MLDLVVAVTFDEVRALGRQRWRVALVAALDQMPARDREVRLVRSNGWRARAAVAERVHRRRCVFLTAVAGEGAVVASVRHRRCRRRRLGGGAGRHRTQYRLETIPVHHLTKLMIDIMTNGREIIIVQ